MAYKKHFTLKQIIVISIILIGSIAIMYIFTKKDEPTFSFIITERGNIIQEVAVTGRVKPTKSVELAFEKTGRIGWINVKVGKRVFAGYTLLGLSNDGVASQYEQAEAGLTIQKANLAELLRGSRIEEIEIQKIKVRNAEISLEDAENNLINNIIDALTKSDDAIRNSVDQFFINPRSSNPQIDLLVINQQLETDIEAVRLLIEPMLLSWQSDISSLSRASDLNESTLSAKENINQTKRFLDDVSFAVNAASANSNVTQTQLDGYRSDISSARININTGISNLSTSERKVKEAQATLALGKQELILLEAGASIEELSAQRARVREAQANVLNKKAELAKTTIHAPFNGIITKQDVRVGEIVIANTIVVSLISDTEFEIEAHIPEADIAKVEIGNIARVTLDAYGDEVFFDARIVSIDPAETIIDGVATYKTTLQFIERDDRIRSGMTANVDIKSGERTSVITVPSRAVIVKDGRKFVRISTPEGIEERTIITGLRSSFGDIEIVVGVEEGEKVITLINN